MDLRGSALCLSAALVGGAFIAPNAAVSAEPAAGFRTLLPLPSTIAVHAALAGAARRLETPACRRVLTEYRAGAGDKAMAAFQAIVASQPDNPDANLGLGLSIYSTGDKTKFQEAANYLQHFVDVAPDAHPFKADAKAILAEMKNTEKITPEKTPPRRKRP